MNDLINGAIDVAIACCAMAFLFFLLEVL